MSGPKKGEQCAAFFWKAGREASLANEGAVEGAAREGGDRNGESKNNLTSSAPSPDKYPK